jgi:hypothetical protein
VNVSTVSHWQLPGTTVGRLTRFGKVLTGEPNKATMVYEMGKSLLKEYPAKEGYRMSLNQAFTGFPEDVGFNNGLLLDIVEENSYHTRSMSNSVRPFSTRMTQLSSTAATACARFWLHGLAMRLMLTA